MKDRIIVADLLKLEGQRTSIRFTELDICPTMHNQSDHGFVGFYKLENGIVRADHGKLSHEQHCKAMSKCEPSAATLTHFLNSALAEHDRDQDRACVEQGRASATVGDTVIIADETFSKDQEIYCHGRNVFTSIKFSFPIGSMKTYFKSTQYLQISSSILKRDETLFTQQHTFTYDHINIVSGICLFNGDIVRASISESQDGGVDPSILNTVPTMYEMEFIARSSSAIADVAATLISRIRERESGVCVNISLDIPCFHYYHSVLKKLERRLCDSRTSLQWMDAVDLRHDRIAEVYTGFIQSQLEQRGVIGGWQIHVSSKSNYFTRSLRFALPNGECPRLEDVLQGLEDENEGSWCNFYRHVPIRDRPRNWEDLGYLFYVFQVVRSALVEEIMPETKENSVNNEANSLFGDSKKQRPRRLIVSIDAAAERRIYSKAKEVLRKIRSSTCGMTCPALVEVYLCRRVFINSNQSRARLYQNDSLPELGYLIQSPEQRSEEQGLIKPLDVVRRIYGADCAQSLQTLFAEAGF